MIREFRAELFCRESGLSRKQVDAADPLWANRIDDFLVHRAGLPAPNSPSEYAELFQLLYPSLEERRLYMAEQIKRSQPSFAHRFLASLLATRQTPCVFTTNFDNLVETATVVAGQLLAPLARASLTIAALDNADRATRCLIEGDWPLLVKIHGDFQSVDLKNTAVELKEQDARLRSVMVEACTRFGMIVVGYSGRDDSVMSALSDALTKHHPFPHGLYWVTGSPNNVLPPVLSLLEKATAVGIDAQIVESQNFDEFAGDLMEKTSFPSQITTHLLEARPSPLLVPVHLPEREYAKVPVLRLSALRINTLPSLARQVCLKNRATIDQIRDHLKQAKVQATVAVAGDGYAAFGKDDDLLRALSPFTPELRGTIELHPWKESWALGLLYDALTRALCRGRPLIPSFRGKGHVIRASMGHEGESEDDRCRRLRKLAPLKAAYGTDVVGKVTGLGYPFAEALRIRMEQSAGRWWCVFDPFTFVLVPRQEASEEGSEDVGVFAWAVRDGLNPAADWVRERWVQRYNRRWNNIIDAWFKLLSDPDGEIRAYWLKDEEGIDATFNIGAVSAWSSPSHDHAYFHRRR